jgi:ribosome-binding factor A
MPENRRPERVAEAIREEVTTFLAEDARDPRLVGLVTVTGVDVTRDLRHAKVYVSVMGSDDERRATMQGLESATGHLRSRIGRALRLRIAPEIAFRYDDSVSRAARIDALLAEVRQPPPPDDERQGD